MNHSPILPILVPFIASIVLLMMSACKLSWQRGVGALAVTLLLAVSVNLLLLADQPAPLVYALGDWQAPFGIVLVADRLAALVVLTTALLSAAVLLYASAGFDGKGRHFHAVFQLQLVGINGAFLTGDVFNLFVFFEVMLLASYILLAHGSGLNKSRAGFAYVTLNLAGSAVFLVALGLIYGTLGTLNLADIAMQLKTVSATEASLVRLSGALLMAVFLLKAAVLPLSFWLPHAYSAAGAPVAALFAIMTKVGIVAILHVQMIAFSAAPVMHGLLDSWLIVAALATIVFAAIGLLSAKSLQSLVAWLILGSAGLLLIVPSLNNELVTAAGLYYLVQSAVVGAAFFMMADLISNARGHIGDAFIITEWVSDNKLKLGYFILAATAAGLPPFSGFVGKLMLLFAVKESVMMPAIWTIILIVSLITTIALAKAGSRLFWETPNDLASAPRPVSFQHSIFQYSATFGLIAVSLLLVIFAQPLSDFTLRAAEQLHAPEQYIEAVIPHHADIQRGVRP
jgi:multicomponent K+:H+ antiporter subunit D